MDAATSEWSVEEVAALRGYAVEWAQPGRLLLSRRERLFSAEHSTAARQDLGAFPAPAWKRLAARFRTAQRALRFVFYNVLVLDSDSNLLFVTFDKQVGLYEGGRFHLLRGLVRPCRVMRGGCAVDALGRVYFGEYLRNPDRGEVNVYRWQPGSRSVEVVRVFPPGSITHVHGIYHDQYTDEQWCVTGDAPTECRMLRTADGFATIEEIGSGDETWRCVSMVFTEAAVYYATDAAFQRNVVYRIDRRSGARTEIHELDGPVYYSAAVGEDLFFAVAAELCPSHRSRAATLWHLRPGHGCREVVSFRRDAWPGPLVPPAALHFPRGPGLAGELFLHGFGLVGSDNRTYRVRRARSDGAATSGGEPL